MIITNNKIIALFLTYLHFQLVDMLITFFEIVFIIGEDFFTKGLLSVKTYR